MTWITHEYLAKRSKSLRLEDMIFLPENLDLFEAEDIISALKILPEEYANIFKGETLDIRDHHPFVIVEMLKFKCIDHFQRFGIFPEWLDCLPRTLLRALDIEQAFHDEDFNHYAIVPEHRFARVPYMVLNDGLVDETVQAFGLARLSGINQLGYLHDAIVDEFGQISSLGWTYQHTRYHHVLNVMALMTLMMRNNGITGSLFNTGRIAALSHDVLTPARGDTTKLLDYEAFDEDKHYPEVFWRYDLSALMQKYQIDKELLIATIQGKGVLGQLLNYADKLAYVATDLAQYLKNPRTAKLDPDPIVTLAERNPFLCTIWDDVHVEDETVFFTDVNRLGAFLNTRAVMFRNFYWHPSTRFLEFIVGSVLLKYLYETGRLNRETLLRMNDSELDEIMCKELGLPVYGWSSNIFGEPQVELFDSFDSAKKREAELIRKGITFVAIENLPRKIKVGTHIKVKVGDEILPLTAAEPGMARLLQSKAVLPYPVRLYFITDLKASKRFLDAFQVFQETRLNSKSA